MRGVVHTALLGVVSLTLDSTLFGVFSFLVAFAGGSFHSRASLTTSFKTLVGMRLRWAAKVLSIASKTLEIRCPVLAEQATTSAHCPTPQRLLRMA